MSRAEETTFEQVGRDDHATRHGGDLRALAAKAGIAPEAILDFSASINPWGPPEWLRPVVSRALGGVVHYPDPRYAELAEAAARRHGARPEEIVAGNGSTELFFALPRAFKPAIAIIPTPSYGDYSASMRASGVPVRALPLREENGFALDWDGLDEAISNEENTLAQNSTCNSNENGGYGDCARSVIVILGQPNNPTGTAFAPERLRALAERRPGVLFVVDEAFADFDAGLDRLTRERPANVIVILSLTKQYAIPGLRLGLATLDAPLAARLRAALPPWSVGTLAQAVGVAAMNDAGWIERARAFVGPERGRVASRLSAIDGIKVFQSRANYLLLKIERAGMDAPELARRLLARGMAIRVCDNFDGLDVRFCRVAIRPSRDNDKLLAAIEEEFVGVQNASNSIDNIKSGKSSAPAIILARRKTPAIMFQGTSSNAGKSVLAAGLCRVLLQDGHRVAPFKAQNMSLNSFVARDGGEMGRAQAVQAQAARLDPDVRMNPILLKPTGEAGSQVIVRGRPVGNMSVKEYFRYKAESARAAIECYDSLAAENGVMVLEGAGSPAEVNLKSNDIVNMAMARHADAPVLLVGDIDRGGVFASFVGCMEVFTEEERSLVGGFIVNRFRGDASLLQDAFDYVLRHAGKPTLGTVPFLRDLGLPEEDSVGFKEGLFNDARPLEYGALEIAVIDLPHVSNFTDLEPLRAEPDVRLRVVNSPETFGAPDAVILPGSKNVAGDLAFLRRTGLDRRVIELAAAGRAEIVGVCGGFQILGERIDDPHGIESEQGSSAPGLGLLPIVTTLEREKTLTRARGHHVESGLGVFGYEIHYGVSDVVGNDNGNSSQDYNRYPRTPDAKAERGFGGPAIEKAGGEPMGARSCDGMIWGSYMHGVFDSDPFRHWFLNRLRERRGLDSLPASSRASYDLEPALDRLAGVLRASLDLKLIYRLAGLR